MATRTTTAHDEAPACAITRAGAVVSLAAQEGLAIMSNPISTTTESVPSPRHAEPVDVIASVGPYDPARPEWVGVSVGFDFTGRYVLLTEPGGKVAFRIPAANADALCAAIRDAAGHGQSAA
jgi:hypothetical protein